MVSARHAGIGGGAHGANLGANQRYAVHHSRAANPIHTSAMGSNMRHAGNINHNQHSRTYGKGYYATTSVPRGGFEGSHTAPWRKTVSIFKQPVTLVHTTSRQTKQMPTNAPQPNSNKTKDKPKQVFWVKRLEGLRAMRPLLDAEYDVERKSTSSSTKNSENGDKDDNTDNDQGLVMDIHEHEQIMENGERTATMEQTALPSRIQTLGPDIDEVSAVASLNAALSNPSPSCHPVLGQTNPKRQIDTNVSAFINCDQPLMQAVVVQQDDIHEQEKRVVDARCRLEELRKHFG